MNRGLTGWALLLACGVALADTRVFELRSANPEELVPVVKPLLGGWESVTTYRQSLVVNASPGTLDRIAGLIVDLDRPLRNLLISVRRGSHHGADDGAIGTRPREDLRQARVQESRPLLLKHDSLLPLPAGGVLGPDILWLNLEDAVAVSARVSAGDVMLDILVRDSRAAGDGKRDTLRTSVQGRLGEWIPLGGSTERQGDSSDIISTRRRDEDIYEVRVEMAP